MRFAERRKTQRYLVKEGAYALPENQVCEMGQIVDISRGGLSFRYIGEGGSEKASFNLDILMHGNGFWLEGLSVMTVFDSEIIEEYESVFSFIKMRRRGVQFANLTGSQASQIDYFIRNCTFAG